jgi:hypothetical protein
MVDEQVSYDLSLGSPSHDVPTIGALQDALAQVAKSVADFEETSRAWSAHRQSGYGSIVGLAWQDFEKSLHQNVSTIKGLRGLKNLVQKELTWLERHASELGSRDVACPSSNAVYICTLWRRVIHAARHQSPIVELDASFPVDATSSTSKLAKVDLVCDSGKLWTRISTIKPIGLLSEFRAAESDITSDNDDDSNSEDGFADTLEGIKKKLAKGQIDIVAEQSSVCKLIVDMDRAAEACIAKGMVNRPYIELILTRLSKASGTSEIEHRFYDEDEKLRYEARIRAIVNEGRSRGVEVILADDERVRSLPGGYLDVPKLPPAHADIQGKPTAALHLDLSALIALISHISHMPLPDVPAQAEDCFSKVHWRRDVSDSPRPPLDSAEDLVDDRDEQHARALGEQLRRETTDDCFFHILLGHLDHNYGEDTKMHFTCTQEARDKMIDIVGHVGGPEENRRAAQLFVSDQDFWHGSRWSQNTEVRSRIVLPVKIVQEYGTEFESTTDDHFTRNALASLTNGLAAFDRAGRGKEKTLSPSVFRQTRHTLASLRNGLLLGETTLTTNISSVKWLVRDIQRTQTRQCTLPGYFDESHGSRRRSAAIWVMFPRSLAEKMVLQQKPGGMISCNDDTILACSSSSLPNLGNATGSKAGSKNGTESSDAPYVLELPNAITPASPSRKLGLLSAYSVTRNFLRGPRPRAHLKIRHYRWWPLRPVEDAWLRVTGPLAWKDAEASDSPKRPYDDVERHLNDPAAPIRDLPDEEDPWWQGVKRDVRLNALHWTVLALTFIGWAIGFSYLCKSLWYEGSVIANDGSRSDTSFFGCTTTFWTANSQCGFNGQSCSPFSTSTPLDFRCPANCQRTTLGGPRAVGDQLPSYVALVVGGSNSSSSVSESTNLSVDTPLVYRGDSFICTAAYHAGALEKSRGGCGRLWLNGAYSGYEAVERFGIQSTAFNSTFPLSYYFDDSVTDEHCVDRRSDGYILDVLLLVFVGFVLRPKSIVYFYTLICVGFFHINFLSEPRQYPMSVGSIMGDFLPTLFIGYAIWRLTVRFVFPAFARLPLEANVWIQGFFWIGTMLDVVFADVPLNRLVARDIADQPGALTSLIVIIVVVLILAVNQVRVIRKTGFLPKYLTLAVIGGILVGLLAAVPTTGLRLHHYVIALVLLPFCAFETRLSLIYVSFLLGMFLNGAGRWGFDGIIQDESVILGLATSGSPLPSFLSASNWTGVSPFVGSNATSVQAINSTSLDTLAASMTGTVYWEPLTSEQSQSWDSFQLLVDDVLRLQANVTSYDLGQLASNYVAFNDSSSQASSSSVAGLALYGLNYTLYPGGDSSANILTTLVEQPHYLRLALYNTVTGNLGDFTRAATVWYNGTFLDPEPGAT